MTRLRLAGVVEGFYGQPWTPAQRLELFDWMAAWGLNAYCYAPKDDLHHRAIWREPYGAADADQLARLIRECTGRRLHFIYALGPGLDIRYSSAGDLNCLQGRLEQMLALGCGHFALLFDDVPDRMGEEDVERWGSLAAAQCHVANALFLWVRARRPDATFLFCPTAYCGRMAAAGLGGEGYLPEIGRRLIPGIDALWTGPEIVSREVTVAHAREMQAVLCRKPVIWDNLHANDYDGRRFFCGPYAGRPPQLGDEVGGILANPNNEFPLNYLPIRSLAAYACSDQEWAPREDWLLRVAEWLPRFKTAGLPVELADLALFADCYYLPYEEGPGAATLYDLARGLLGGSPADWGGSVEAFRREAARLRAFCERVPALRDRALFHALSRRVWELREELDLIDRFISSQPPGAREALPAASDFHQPGTYRGGLVARLQQLLIQCPDGTFIPAPPGGCPPRPPAPTAGVTASS